MDNNLSNHIHVIRPHGALRCPKTQIQFGWGRQAIVITLCITITPKHGFNVSVTEHKLVLILIWKPRGPEIMNQQLQTKGVLMDSDILHGTLITRIVTDTLVSPVLILHAVVYRVMVGLVLMIIGTYVAKTTYLAVWIVTPFGHAN